VKRDSNPNSKAAFTGLLKLVIWQSGTSNYEVNRVTGLDDLKRREFSTDVYGFAKARLKEMLSSGEIIDIERK